VELQPGATYGDFRIVRPLGRGGMAVVYEAEQLSLRRRVALKVLPDFYAASEEAVVRFRKEAEAGARLHHPHIVQVYEMGRIEQTHFIAMELVPGRSLDQVINEAKRRTEEELAREGAADAKARRSHALSRTTDRVYIERAVRLFIDVLDALEHAHSHGVVHRDIKPPNLLMDEEGRIRISDFGLARLVEDPGLSTAGELRGTPWYMSPEQVMQGWIPIDHRTDIYSAGVTLFELLTLDRPFPGEDITSVLRQIVQKEPPQPRSINPRLPRDLQTIVLKALDKDPDRRYRSAKEFADDLRRFLDYEEIHARPVGTIRRFARRIVRHKAVASLSAALALTVVVGAVYVARDAFRTARVRETLLAEAERHRAAGAFDLEVTALEELARHAGDGEAAARLAEAMARRRGAADAAIDEALRLLQEQRFERARERIARALRFAPSDPAALELQDRAAGLRQMRVSVTGGPCRIHVAEYVQVRHAFAPAASLGSATEGRPLTVPLGPGDYLMTARADDGRFAQTFITVDPLLRMEEVDLHIPEAAADGMVRIAAGRYPIGIDGTESIDASPRHKVELRAFWIDACEATNARFDRYLAHLRASSRPLPPFEQGVWDAEGRLVPEAASLPVHGLSWKDASAFLAYEGKRLPTEAEWEAAARGVEGSLHPWGDAWDPAKANVGTGTLEPADSRGGAGYVHGLCHMLGNTAEWTADRFLAYPGYVEPLPTGPEAIVIPIFDPNMRVARGGAARLPPHWARSYYRCGFYPGSGPPTGVRGVRSETPGPEGGD
jgi:formylglycine-generating enzyme required for sulfatase activity